MQTKCGHQYAGEHLFKKCWKSPIYQIRREVDYFPHFLCPGKSMFIKLIQTDIRVQRSNTCRENGFVFNGRKHFSRPFFWKHNWTVKESEIVSANTTCILIAWNAVNDYTGTHLLGTISTKWQRQSLWLLYFQVCWQEQRMRILLCKNMRPTTSISL